MRELRKFYIDGQWVNPSGTRAWEVMNPATEQVAGRVALGDAADVDHAVRAARAAFAAFSRTTPPERIALLEALLAQLKKRGDDLAAAMTEEMGCPGWVAREAQLALPTEHTTVAIENLKAYPFTRDYGPSQVQLVPVGVCGLITPWNWPISVIFTKVLPAVATGCTMVLKPSEHSPFSATIVAEMIDAAGFPPGVFNLVHGDGPTVGVELSTHPEIDLVSITGSTRAGAEVARNAAGTIKRVHQELGGKSPNVILESADIPHAVSAGLKGLMFNAGQSCSAPSRMIAPRSKRGQILTELGKAATEITVGTPDSGTFIGPVVNATQYERIQQLIEKGIEEGATVVVGGPGKPEGLETGYYVRPTILADVEANDVVAQQEIFGPVLVVQFYDDADEAVELANGTRYGLASYIQGGDLDELHALARRIPAGQVYLNGSGLDLIDFRVPFGGHKASGNGREWGDFSFEGYLEPVAVLGYTPSTV